MSKVLIDLLTAAKLTEHSLSIVLEELDELRELQRGDHDRITRIETRMQHDNESDLEERRSAVIKRGQHVQASATVLAALIGAIAGIGSLVWNILHTH